MVDGSGTGAGLVSVKYISALFKVNSVSESVSMVKIEVSESKVKGPLSGGKKVTPFGIHPEDVVEVPPVRPGVLPLKNDVVPLVPVSVENGVAGDSPKTKEVHVTEAGIVMAWSSVIVALIVSP
jgi:hypothetical protein